MFRKWPIGKGRERREDATDTFGIHDERPHVIRRVRIGFEVGHVVADPSLLRLVPPNLPRSLSHGLPDGSHDARLYITRRLAGHDQAQFG